MNLHLLDGVLIVGLLAVMAFAARSTRRYNRSVADFLAANRCAGRYMLAVAMGIANLGAVSIVAMMEGYYASGFTFLWWGLLQVVVVRNIVALSGWVQYRFRETRALTMPQFLEMRYSRNFRIVAGITAFASGVLNFGLFPAVGTRFFMYFCGLPSHPVALFGGLTLDVTYAGLMLVLLLIALYFTFAGGQIAVIVTDFVQGVFFNVILIATVVFLLIKLPWGQISAAILDRPPGQSMVDPFNTSDTKTFNMWYYIIIAYAQFWCHLAWQGGGAYYASARNAHEARMGQAMGCWREYTQMLLLVILAVCAYTVMHHPDWSGPAQQARTVLQTVSTNPEDTIRQQVTPSVALSAILPVGLLGGFAAIMLAAFISTHDSYLHSWGTIFIQDVVLPFRRRRLDTQTHLRWLKWSICGVAAFIYLFALFFPQTQAVLLFFALTGTLFLGGAGTVIVFGLYWKRGTTAAAYAALVVGWVLFAFGVYAELIWPGTHGGKDFPINAQGRFFIAMLSSTVLYVVVSLLTCKQPHNMDRLLHRGAYALADDQVTEVTQAARGWQVLFGMNRDFTRLDKVVYCTIGGWSLLWAAIFFLVVGLQAFIEFSTGFWCGFWHFYVWMAVALGAITTVWFSLGGLWDMRKMFRRLRTMARDDADDGEIVQPDKTPAA